MLQRLSSLHERPIPGPRWPCTPARPGLTRWLRAPGSLTARLRQHGPVSVEVVRQGTQRLTPPERRALKARSGHVREVVLRVDDRVAVWARSVTTHRALKGPWKALKGLGTRPLAELLFGDTRVSRGALVRHPWRRHGPEHNAARRSTGLDRCHTPRWARASVFTHHGQRLRVMEAFAPDVQRLRP